MTRTFIASIPKSSMHALAFQGITVSSCYAQIRDMLLRKFGDDYMLLFARPEENPGNGEIDWYSPVQGPVRKLEDLPEDEREPIERRLSEMGGDILRYAEELIQTGSPQKVTRGNILRLALSYPSRGALYVVGQQPVFTCWGFGPGTPGVEPENLWRVIRTSPAKAAPKAPQSVSRPVEESAAPAAAPVSRAAWLFWLWPLLPLVLLLLLLFGSFGHLPPLAGVSLFSVPGPWGESGIDPARITALRDEITSLDSRLKSHVALCMPNQPAETPKVSEPSMPRIEEPEAPAAEAPKLVIPENAIDASFLEGRWLCETGLANKQTGEPVKVYLRFDDKGVGEVVTYEQNDRCTGSARAAMNGQSLHIEVSGQKCEKNPRGYSSMGIDCKNGAGSQTICYGQHKDGGTWDANFARIN